MGILDRLFKSNTDIKKSNMESLHEVNDEYIHLFNNIRFRVLIKSKLGFNIKKTSDLEKIPKEFLDRCLNDDYLSVLLENSYGIKDELFKKIVDNTISLDDLHFDELYLINILPQSSRVSTLVNRDLTGIDTQSKYVIIDGNDNLSSDVYENLIYANSYIEGIKIVIENQRYVKCCKTMFGDDNVKIFNKSAGKICEKGYLVNNSDVLNSDSIIVLSFEKYKELSKNPKYLEILNNHIFIISDSNKEMQVLSKIDKEYSLYDDIDYKNVNLVKYNHIIKIISESNLSKPEKEYYLYKISNTSSIFNINKIVKEIISKVDHNEVPNITDKFNMLSYEEKTSKVESIKYSMEIFNYLYPKFFELDINNQINLLLYELSESELEIVLEDPNIKKLFDEEVNNYRDLYMLCNLLERVRNVSKCVKDFIEKQGLDIKKILQAEEYKLKSQFDINPILAEYWISDEEEKKEVSMEDIGFDKWHIRGETSNIVDNLSSFFDADIGDGYHTRGISMLNFKNGDEAMQKLFYSFEDEPLRLSEYDGKYVVVGNGCHRSILLRFFYIKDLLEGKSSNEELRKKYTIPNCEIKKANYEKTYLHYLLKLLNPSIKYVYNDIKESSSLTIRFSNKEEKEMQLEEIKTLIKDLLSTSDIYMLNKIKEIYNKYESFKSFIDNNFLDYIKCEEINNEKNI